jgi:hypothetical protein
MILAEFYGFDPGRQKLDDPECQEICAA